MLRMAEPLLGNRIGGWAVVESPPQRTAVSGQQWSLLILTTAALVAMLAVVFDLRLSSDNALHAALPDAADAGPVQRTSLAATPATVPPPTSVGRGQVEASSPAAEAVARSSATNAATRADAQRTAVVSAASPDTAQSSGAATAVQQDGTVAAPSRVDDAASSVDAVGAAATGAAPDDPASRIRDHLGLHAAAPLPVSFAYEVAAGDTASSIAARFGLEEATVLFNNFDIYDPNHLTVGQLLQLPAVDGLVYTVQSGDVFDSLMENFQGDREATLAYPANELSSADQIFVGQKLLLVHGSASMPASSAAASTSAGGGQSTQVWAVPTFVWPLGYDEISDPFGTPRANSAGYHTGVDFTAAVGTIVGSTAAGQVSVATWDPSYGNWIEIDHGGGYRSRYAHLNEIWVREGEWVPSNAYIGTVGNTGNSSGAHLHFEIIVEGQAVNPLAWLN